MLVYMVWTSSQIPPNIILLSNLFIQFIYDLSYILLLISAPVELSKNIHLHWQYETTLIHITIDITRRLLLPYPWTSG